MAHFLDIAAVYLFALKGLLGATALIIAISSADDLLIDVIYYLRRLYRHQTVYRRHQPKAAPGLAGQGEQWTAIMVPAWQEAAVIGQMLTQLRAGLKYRHYVVFVGYYANDPDTAAAVTAVIAANPAAASGSSVVPVPLGRDGPTSKADCLNSIYQETLKYEQKHGWRFGIYVLHDAEDIVHPLELCVFDHLIPRKDMVQLPVAPLPRAWHQWVGGHYLDEFAESHAKDLVVRECLTGGVPSAGVGCAFSRRALRLAGQAQQGHPFNAMSVTEDYELALRLRQHGLKSAFVRIAATEKGHQAIATREYFPASFNAAVRQKSRWLLGIALQGWETLGWRGGPWHCYMLMRDRKAIITSQINIIAYFIALNVLLLWLGARFWPGFPHFPGLVDATSPTALLLWANLFFLLNRLFQRMICVYRIYGLGQAMLSAPRQLVANAVNFCAAIRAIRLYAISRQRRQPVIWDKTAHEMPLVPGGEA